jgi:O-methyltransferase involved in polyketide biosynthesis
MSKKAADTAASVGAVIAIEQHFPRDERLIDDGLAGRLLPLGMRVFVWLLRFAWLRDWIIRSSEKGAPGAWAIFPVRKRYIDAQELGSALASHGYSSDMKTFFVLEAVTQYLTMAGIQTTFDFLAKAQSGSRLVFTYVRKDFVEGRAFYDNEDLYRRMVLKDKVWLFGLNPVEVADFLSGYGWRVLEHVGYEDLADAYVKPTGRQLESLALERIVYAEKR